MVAERLSGYQPDPDNHWWPHGTIKENPGE
jgi:hypothetical protein